MSTQDRADLMEELRLATQRSTMYTVLLHHTTASKSGMNVTDAQCINTLVLDGPQTPGQLAQVMGITTGGAITAVIDRLEKAGFVKRTRDPDDRRRVIVEVVPQSVARFASYFEPMGRAFAERSAGYTEEQLRFLLEWISGNNAMMPAIIKQIQELP